MSDDFDAVSQNRRLMIRVVTQLLAEAELRDAGGDPLAPFDAAQIAAKHQVPLPVWATRRFADAAARLHNKMTRRGETKYSIANDVGEALGFSARSKTDNPWAERRKQNETCELLGKYLEERTKGKSATASIKALAIGYTERTIAARLDMFTKTYGLANLAELEAVASLVPVPFRASPQMWVQNIAGLAAGRQIDAALSRGTQNSPGNPA